MTIELGFAELQLPAPFPPSAPMQVGIIDVPGHEDFVKNMIAGMGCVNLGLIVVAADDGWMPQTEEHFQILEYLGVQRLVIALNKIDLAEEDEDFLREVVKDELSGTAFENAPIVATSAASGRGVSELKQTLASILDSLPDPPDIEKPRLSVDRAFSVKGHGTVVTGSLADGRFHVEQSVVVQPQGISARIRSMQCFGRAAESAGPGTRVAINLANVDLRSTLVSMQEGVGRGDVVTAENFGKAGRAGGRRRRRGPVRRSRCPVGRFKSLRTAHMPRRLRPRAGRRRRRASASGPPARRRSRRTAGAGCGARKRARRASRRPARRAAPRRRPRSPRKG